MTHDKLMDFIDKFDCAGMVNEPAVKALRAVVELHQEYTTADGVAFCVKCCTPEKQLQYPCPTIQVIHKALNNV